MQVIDPGEKWTSGKFAGKLKHFFSSSGFQFQTCIRYEESPFSIPAYNDLHGVLFKTDPVGRRNSKSFSIIIRRKERGVSCAIFTVIPCGNQFMLNWSRSHYTFGSTIGDVPDF